MRIQSLVTTRVIARLFVLLVSATIGFATLAQTPTDPDATPKAAPPLQPSKPSPEPEKPKEPQKEKPTLQKIDAIEVKSSQDSYDARREDTATKIVVTEEEILKYGDTQIADVLKRQPGITVTGGAIRMRGLGNGYTQILLNGERAPPGFSLDTLSPSVIERIEIIRAATAEFSTQSIAGTINIILKKKVTVSQRELKLGYASGRGYTSPNANFNISDKDSDFSYSFNGYYYRNEVDYLSSAREVGTDIRDEQNLFRESSSRFKGLFDGAGLSPRLNWTLKNGDTLTWQSFINYNRGRNDNDRRYGILVGPPPPYAISITQSKYDSAFARTDVNWVHKLAEGAKLDVKIGASSGERNDTFTQQGFNTNQMQNLDSTVLSESSDKGTTFTGKYSTPIIEGHSLVAGWDGGISNRTEIRDQRDKALQGALPGVTPIVSYEDFAASVSRIALFAQDEWNVTKDWSVYFGVRWESLDTKSDGNTFATVKNRSSVLSPLFQTLYKLKDRKGEQVRLALTRTYKAPTTSSLIPRRFTSTNNSPTEPDSQGNPDLRAELATGIDIAYEKFWDQGASVSVSGSIRRITDFNRRGLIFVNGRWVSLPINDGTAQTKSLEFDTKFPIQVFYKAAPPIDFRFNMNRNWSIVDSVPGPNNRLDQQTPFSATVGLDYRMKGGEFTAGGSYSFKSGGLVRTSINQSRNQSARRELDVYGLWKFTPKIQTRLTLSNILRQDNESESSYFDEFGRLSQTSINPSSMNVRLNLELKF
jgi:outer membrane receptor for ferrienterochelin and colicins